MAAITQIGTRLGKTGGFVNFINSAKITNPVSSPNAAAWSVAALILTNKTCRVYAALNDKKEKPKARYYTALTDGMHEVFCLFTLFAVRPMFFLAGLALGKKGIAKKAFKAIDIKAIRQLKIPELIKKPKNTLEFWEEKKAPGFIGKKIGGIKSLLSGIKPFFYNKAGLRGIDEVWTKVETFNRTIDTNVREALFGKNPREIVVKTKEGLMTVTEKGREAKKFINKFLGSTTDSTFIDKAVKEDFIQKTVFETNLPKASDVVPSQKIIEKTARRFHDDGKILLTEGRENMGGNYDEIKGSRCFGEAIGMAVTLSFISPLVTTAYVPVVCNALGIAGSEKHAAAQKRASSNVNLFLSNVSSKSNVGKLRQKFLSSINS